MLQYTLFAPCSWHRDIRYAGAGVGGVLSTITSSPVYIEKHKSALGSASRYKYVTVCTNHRKVLFSPTMLCWLLYYSLLYLDNSPGSITFVVNQSVDVLVSRHFCALVLPRCPTLTERSSHRTKSFFFLSCAYSSRTSPRPHQKSFFSLLAPPTTESHRTKNHFSPYLVPTLPEPPFQVALKIVFLPPSLASPPRPIVYHRDF